MYQPYPRQKLEELALSVDYGITASATTAEVGPAFLRITDIQNDRVNWENVPFCSTTESAESGARLAVDDIVFARTGATTGKSFLVRSCPERAVFASYLIRVRPNPARVDARYLAWFFQTPDYWCQIDASASGTAQPGVNATKLKALSVPVPVLAEQRRIADLLDKADAIRRRRRGTIAVTEELLRSAFLEMFGDPVTNTKGWPTKPLGELVVDFEAGWSANGEGRRHRSDEYGVLKISAVTSGHFLPDEHKAVSASLVDRQLVSPRKGDLLFSRANTRELVAATCLVDEDHPRLFLPDKLWKIVPNALATTPFLRFLLSHDGQRTELTKTATGTSGSMLNISMQKLRALRLPVPPRRLQDDFGRFVWMAFAMRRDQLRAATSADDLFSSVAHRVFRGELLKGLNSSQTLLDFEAAHAP